MRSPSPARRALRLAPLVVGLLAVAPAAADEGTASFGEVIDVPLVEIEVLATDREGRPVAYTELVVPRHDPGAIFQWGTLVEPAHRGHRLGMATKVANLRWVLAEEPDRDRVYTMNAEVNDNMIAINEALGFKPVERHVSLTRKLG